MLELKKITKIYETKDLKQKALDNVSVSFRKNEFAAILGQSGSGKTTLLNIIGGLDDYTSGNLVINETSTKDYTEKDWDSYRNHRIGFVFQSYNLISHQSILSNVELALTLSGVSKDERRKRAKKALTEVGLQKHLNKKPSQLSGGQMQRVAIARALVNEPEIILADEPTGALDSETSIQIMELLKKVAENRLVIMVTHNPELASSYATRIIKLKDGHIIDDTNYYDGLTDSKELDSQDKKRKTSMNLKTALSLSFNNLKTKKGRTILTAFAGSIGIIGIALILALSNGVQEYINKVEQESLSSYPLQIEKNTTNKNSLMSSMDAIKNYSRKCSTDKICTSDDISINPLLKPQSIMKPNNLEGFKKYLDNNEEIKDYITDIGYSYDLDLQIYNNTENLVMVNPNTLPIYSSMSQMPMGTDYQFQMMSSMKELINPFKEMINNDELLSSQYEILEGRMPEVYNEVVLIVDDNNNIPLSVIYSLDLENREELTDALKAVDKNGVINLKQYEYNYNTFIGKMYKLVLNTDYYKKEDGKWVNKALDPAYLKNIVNNGLDLKITGVAKIRDESTIAMSGFVGYTHKLTEYVINKINKTDIAKEQIANKKINILTGLPFDAQFNTYENALINLGIVNLDKPSTINIYPKNYEAKDNIKEIIEKYNSAASENNKITYNDIVDTLMSGITTIVDVISYVLIAFVAISLIVSSIMIAIITYISVLERTKEIGILRSIGASKKDITRVFNAETLIEGFTAGLLGIIVTFTLCLPINMILGDKFGISTIARLPIDGAIILIIISVVLTVIAGLIPARMASKKDPVEALRSE